jgi:hypothetical protein
MRVLAPVIEIATLAMFHPQHHLAFSGGVAPELKPLEIPPLAE